MCVIHGEYSNHNFIILSNFQYQARYRYIVQTYVCNNKNSVGHFFINSGHLQT